MKRKKVGINPPNAVLLLYVSISFHSSFNSLIAQSEEQHYCNSKSESFSRFSASLNLIITGKSHVIATQNAQEVLYESNHPLDCNISPILLCSTQVNKFQGTGSRLFFLGRCLTEGINSGRTVILSNALSSTLDMLQPFEPWSNCSLSHAQKNTGKGRVRMYYPMDSESLVKSPDMPAVGALFPKIFHDRGYWWWKAQEISYALRPTIGTMNAFVTKTRLNSIPPIYAAFQIRRTDKTGGCDKIYGTYLRYCLDSKRNYDYSRKKEWNKMQA